MGAVSTRSFPLGQWLAWGGFALALMVLPQVLTSGLALNMLSQMGTLIIICLSYNILLGQGGMLSFGHAVYTGMGGFAVVMLINYVSDQQINLPLVWTPLIGGLAGMAFAIPLGYVSTKKAGTTFAMISLGIGELIVATAVMLPGVFGGDAGISIDRVYGDGFMGWDFGPDIQVYYLIAVYCFISTALMYAFTRTPLGRMLNAVRDNPERVEFIGYNTQRVRWYGFIISGFFAGIGGALAAISFEIVNAVDALGGIKSGSYLLFTFLGGVTVFYGPIIGAILMVLASVLMSELTNAWLLYLGLAFLLMVMYAPGGVASLIVANAHMARFGKLGRLWGGYASLLGAGALFMLGLSALVEMIYHYQLNAAMGPTVRYLGTQLDTSSTVHWMGALAITVVGAVLLRWVIGRVVATWGQAEGEIAALLRQRQQEAA